MICLVYEGDLNFLIDKKSFLSLTFIPILAGMSTSGLRLHADLFLNRALFCSVLTGCGRNKTNCKNYNSHFGQK